MIKKTLLLFLIGLVAVLTQAQDKNLITISGKIVDVDNVSVEFANVAILSKDSVLISGVTTNNAGGFLLKVPGDSKYILKVSYLGYIDLYKDLYISGETDLGNIKIAENSFLLGEATVTARANEIEVKGDTVEYNADSYKVQDNAVIEDLLKKMPGVQIDSDGKITINGKEIKKIMVDGKEFFSDDPKVASKNLPAKMVDKLQVLDKKSDMAMLTGFDDGEEETVINLKVKPGMKKGVFGNSFIGGGNKDKYEGNAFVNLAKDNTSITVTGGANNTNNAGASDLASAMFGNSGGGPRGLRFGGSNGITKSINGGINIATEIPDKLKISTDLRYMNTDNLVVSKSEKLYTSQENPGKENEDANGRNKNNSVAAAMRLEWTPDKLTKIIFKPRVELNNNNRELFSNSETLYDDISPLASKNNYTTQTYTSDGNGHKLSGDLDISRKLNDKGRVVTIGLSGATNGSDSKGYNWNEIKYFNQMNDSVIDQKFDENTKKHNWKVTASYVEPIRKNLFAELSYRISGVYEETDKHTFLNDNLSEISLNYSKVDTTNTRYVKNEFINQNISLKIRGMAPQYNWMLGLALEPSSSNTKINMPDNPNIQIPRKNYLNFTPVAQFNYIPSKTTNLRIDYNANTSQPSSLMLFDGVYSRSGLNTTSGNPNLRPSFTSNLNLRLRSSNPTKGSFMFARADFNHTANAIVSTSKVNPNTGGKDSGYDNVNGNMGGNIRFIFNTPLKNRNWSINSMSYVGYNINNSLIDNQKNKAKILNLQENIGLQFKSDILDFALRGNMRYNNIRNSLTTSTNNNSVNYGGTYDFTLYAGEFIQKEFGSGIFKGFNIESDINYSTNSGYASGYKQNEWLWNASITKELFSSGTGTGSIRFKIYDILKQRSNISRNYTATYIEDVKTNTMTRYFMVHFVYRFQILGKGMKMEDMKKSEFGPGHGGPGRRPM